MSGPSSRREAGKRQVGTSKGAPKEAAAAAAARAPAGFWSTHGWRLAALWTLCLIAYSNSFSAGLIFDNRVIIVDDARVHAANGENVRRILTTDYWPDRQATGLYRPVTTLSYLVNYAVLGNGESPAGYHWVNSILHGLNVSLVYALGIMIFGAWIPALALAALWGVHPMLTEAVTNVIGRADILAGFGVLAGLLCYLKGRSARGGKAAWIAGAGLAQSIGLFSKESGIVLVGVMALADLTIPSLPVRTKWAARGPFYGVVVAVCAAFVLARAALHAHIEIQFIDNPLAGAGFFAARLTAMKILFRYMWMFFWPAHLSADYSFNTIPVVSWLGGAMAILGVLLTASGIVWTIRERRTQWRLLFFAGFFLITLFPASNLAILIGTIMAERFAYLPFAGMAGCAVILLEAVARRTGSKQLTPTAAAVICAVFAVRTYARNADWRDDATLWTRTVETVPQSAKAHLNLGRVFLETPGRLPDAVAEYETALRIEPDYALAQYSLATALVQMPGHVDDAISHFRAALRLEPNYPEAHNGLGNTLAQSQSGFPEAVKEYRAALALNPRYIEAHSNLANVLASMPGRLPEAIAEYQAALRIDPRFVQGHYNLGSLFGKMDRWREAIGEFRIAIEEQPNLAEGHYNLGIALAKTGQIDEAARELESAYRLQPDPAIQQMIDQLKAARR